MVAAGAFIPPALAGPTLAVREGGGGCVAMMDGSFSHRSKFCSEDEKICLQRAVNGLHL